ncbi:MAG: hypothetical protein DCC67_09305 [Planctomycetota bacterium]|nr:MAG: hypothetical protein DCC67_09305 [Planctomycetota bacterium]
MGKRINERRPAGVSRRRKKQFSFEPLEDRRVMSATPLVAPPAGTTEPLALQVQSWSSNTLAGQLAILERELYCQSLSTSTPTVASPLSVPTDPLLPQQWHLINSGQQVGNPDFQNIFGLPGEDINVAPVWNMGYTGRGVTVAVIDSGVQSNHPDLAGNISTTIPGLNAAGADNNSEPSPAYGGNAHGTAVAGIIAAVANNGIGGAGIAPGATIVPIRFLDNTPDATAAIDAFRYHIQDIDITNNSWGPAVDRGLAGPNPFELLALRDSVIFGRGGLGVIHVFASGNSAAGRYNEGFPDLGAFDTAAYNGWVNSRYTIAVTGVDHDGFYNNIDGTVTGYPEAGPSILVAAPTGSNALAIVDDTGLGSGIITTDLTGTLEDRLSGYNFPPDDITGEELDRDFLADDRFTTRFNGTSAAAPMVTGVIALMLEANPNLSWRDVQEILVRSARQNAQFDTPADGAGLLESRNLWITNQQGIFQEPDLFDPTIPPLTQTFNPLLDPQFNRPFAYANGAGYTVSQGYGVHNEQLGYGHGTVDAELAVKLAEQWHVKSQNLPAELSFTTFAQAQGDPFDIPAAERSNDDSGNQIVPGGIGGEPGFISFWEEYFTDDAFQDPDEDFPSRGLPFIEFSVPDSNAMTVETVEVKLSISGGTADALDHLRITLVSPQGTHSELNHYNFDPEIPSRWQTDHPAMFRGSPGSVDTTGGNLVWTFSTNRSWGERSDDALYFDPLTGEPLGTRGWRLYIENYDLDTAFGLDGVEMSWHGSPIAASTQRIQGFVGVDENRDDLFNYSRFNLVNNDTDGEIRLFREGIQSPLFPELDAQLDMTQEKFAANVTVVARRVSDGAVVDRFVTGADGNYYFDLAPDDYIISIEDPAGRLAQDDSITGAGFLSKYKSEWLITEDFFQVWAVDPSGDVPVDASGVPVPFPDTAGLPAHVQHINFLLDPGDPPPQQVEFTGVVYADANGDAVFNGNDVALSNVSVFADANRNGQRDAGETVVQTDSAGQYTLIVAGVTDPSVLSVGVVTPAQWTITNPAAKVHTRFAEPGDEFAGLDFFIKPPADNIGGGGANQPGILLGVVYNDANNNGVREATELGTPNFTVYIDANNNGVVDAGDTSTVTNQFGAYAFTNVAPGQRVVRVVAPSPFVQTSPLGGAPRIVTLTGSSTISNLLFGIRDTAVLDYGDLPANYGLTTLAQNGARHRKGVYWLGASIDGELNGNASADASGDDAFGVPDEDGIQFGQITPGGTTQLVVTASRNNGYLKGWVDWNNDGNFNGSNERLLFTGAGGTTNNVLLNAGANTLYINVPAGVSAANVYARFRYGEATLGSPFGEALIGEVEDYELTVVPPVGSVVAGIPADFNQNGQVEGSDFLSWQRNFGRTTQLSQAAGNANGDGAVNAADLLLWKQQFGTATQSSSASAALLAAEETAAGATALSNTVVIDGALATRLATAADGVDRATLAARLREAAERIDERFDAIGDEAVAAVNRAGDAASRDGAFDELSARRRPNFRPGLEAVTELADGDADEAFAALGRGL